MEIAIEAFLSWQLLPSERRSSDCSLVTVTLLVLRDSCKVSESALVKLPSQISCSISSDNEVELSEV